MLVLRYRSVSYHARPVVFQQLGYPTVYRWEPTKLTEPQGTEVIQICLETTPRRVAVKVNYLTRITQRVF